LFAPAALFFFVFFDQCTRADCEGENYDKADAQKLNTTLHYFFSVRFSRLYHLFLFLIERMKKHPYPKGYGCSF